VRELTRASALRRDPCTSLPDRQRCDHRRQLRGVALLRAPAPAVVCLPRLLLPLHRQRLLPRSRAVGRQLDHFDVPARQLGSHPGQHALPRGLRQERRGLFRAHRLPRLLLRRRLRRDPDPGADDPDPRHRGGSASAQPRCERRDRRRPRRLLHSLPELDRVRADRCLPGADLGVVLSRLWFLYQLYEANVGIFSSSANGGGVAFFAHVGGFVFGLLAIRIFSAGRPRPVRPAY